MIVSHKYKFIFIKTRKTAGTSIELYLSNICGPEDVFTPIEPHVPPHVARNFRGFWNLPRELVSNRGKGFRRDVSDWVHFKKFYNHASADTVKRRLPAHVWNEYYKFCVERNPWDKTLSHFHHLRKLHGRDFDLDHYLKNGRFCIDYAAYCNPVGELMVDRVLKYENLNKELDEVFAYLKIPFKDSLQERAKSNYRQDRRAYQEVLNHEQRERITSLFDHEINLHGYKY